MKINFGLLAGIAAIGTALYFISNPKPVLIITDYGTAFDYKYDGSRWFGSEKGKNDWIDLKENMSAENYATVTKQLTDWVAASPAFKQSVSQKL